MRAELLLVSLVLGCLTLGLWTPDLGPRAVRSRVLVVDRSASAVARGLDGRILELACEEALADLDPEDRVALVAFGDGARLVAGFAIAETLTPRRLADLVSSQVPELRSASRLSPELMGVLDHLLETAPGAEVVIIGDGTLTRPAPAAAWRAIVPPLSPLNDVAVRLDTLPARAAPHRELEVPCWVCARGRTRGVVLLRTTAWVDQQRIASRSVALTLEPDVLTRHTERIHLPAGGSVRIEVALQSTQGDSIPENDRDEAWVDIGDRCKGLWISANPLPRALAPLCAWDVLPPGTTAPANRGYDILWLDEVPATSFTGEQAQRFVEDGGTIVLTASALQFEGGGYDRAPWDGLLPVLPNPDDAPREVFVALDHSGSMGREGNRRLREAHLAVDGLATRWGASARVVAAAFADALGPSELLKEAGASVARPLRERFAGARGRGSTRLAHAMEQAAARMRPERPAWLVVVTDGEEEDEETLDRNAATRVGNRLGVLGIDVLLLAIGPERDGLDAFLRRLVGPQGRVLWVDRTENLAAALERGITWTRESSGNFSVRRTAAAPAGVGTPSTGLTRMRRSRVRPGASGWLEVADGELSGDPVLAVRVLGLGRVVWGSAAWDAGFSRLLEDGVGLDWLEDVLDARGTARLDVTVTREARAVLRDLPATVGAVKVRSAKGEGEASLLRVGRSTFAGTLGEAFPTGDVLELLDPGGAVVARGRLPGRTTPEFDPTATTYGYPVAWKEQRTARGERARSSWRIFAVLSWMVAHVFVWYRGRGSRPKRSRTGGESRNA